MSHVIEHEPSPIVIDGQTVKAGQVWETRSGRKVLTVNLLRQTKGHHIGFVWHDQLDCDVNVTEVQDQLKTFLFEGDCTKWEDMLTRLQKTSEKS